MGHVHLDTDNTLNLITYHNSLQELEPLQLASLQKPSLPLLPQDQAKEESKIQQILSQMRNAYREDIRLEKSLQFRLKRREIKRLYQER